MRKSAGVYLGIDLGAGSGRAVAGILDDGNLTIRELHRFTNSPVELGGTLYWDFLSLWSNVLESMLTCARRGHGKIAGIGLDTWGVDWGLLDDDGKLVANPLCYRDAVTADAPGAIEAKLGSAELYRLTGQVLTRVSTLAQLVGLSRGPNAAALKSARTLLMMPDLFRYFLCGQKGVELTAAGSSQLSDVRTTRWSGRIFNTFKLPRRIMPRIVRPASIAGNLFASLAAQTGLNRAPVVAVAGHDTASAAAAVPFIDDDCAFISSGTWSCLGVVQDGPTTSAEAKRHGFINEFGVDSILFLKNLAGLYLFENLRRAEMRKGQAPTYARMIRQAAGARPFARMINVNSPVFFVADDPVASVKDFLKRTGQGPGVALAEMTRGILEGVAFSYRQAFADLQHVTGRKLRRICMVGGGIRNGMLCQMTADATGLEVVAGPAEATVAGNLGLQALATGRLRCIADIRELVRRSFRLRTYRPRSAELWNKHAQRHAEVVGKSARLK